MRLTSNLRTSQNICKDELKLKKKNICEEEFIYNAPSDPCPTDLDRILWEGQDPGAKQYLVLGTVPIKGKKPGVLGAHAFFVLSTVPIKKKRLQVKPKANKLYKEALEQCNHNNHVSKFI